MSENSVITKTEYLSGFQYKGSMLQFFPHAEGYVNVVDNHGVNNYNYVFNYTDHLGNIRVSYGVDPETSSLKIMEENHYYAFGLKHTNYNSDQLLYQKGSSGAVALKGTTTTIKPVYKYKFQGQERQDELGLNWDSFKWRNYDYAIGRFMSIDPLSEEYSYQSHYNFSENVVVNSRELEGLERKIAIVLGEQNTTEFDSNLKSLSDNGYETSKVTTGQELISEIQKLNGGDKLESVVFLSHGYEGGMMGGEWNKGVYTAQGLIENARGDNKGIGDLLNDGASTSLQLGDALKKVGFTENGEVVLGGCNLGISKEIAVDRYKAYGKQFDSSTQIGGFAGELAKSAGVPVTASSPEYRSWGESSGKTQPYPTSSNNTPTRQTSGEWIKFMPNGTENKVSTNLLNLSN